MFLTRIVGALLVVAGLGPAALAQEKPTTKPGIVRVVMETDKGDIAVSLDSARAPVTVTNFLRYVDGGFYSGGRFHRTVTTSNQPNNAVRIEVIQGGPNPQRQASGFPAIELERTSGTGLHHRDGTISMARAAATNTATSDFFICIGDQPSLDFGGKRNPDGQGFAAFGQVTKGMDVVRAIQGSPAQGQTLTPPIAIRRIRRIP